MGARQRAEQRRVIRLRSAGGEMSSGFRTHPCASRDRSDHMTFQSHRHGRGSRTRELRIEQSHDSIGTLRGKICPGIEQAEISRIRHLHDAMLHAIDGPAQGIFERLRRTEVEALQLGAEFMDIDCRRDRARLDALQRRLQFERQPTADSLTVRSVRK